MPSSQSSNLQSKSRRLLGPKASEALTWVCRIILGGAFAVSGYVKAIDIWGTLYKLEDYAGAMGFDISDTLFSLGAFALPAAEFTIGVCLLLGCFRRVTAWCATAVMAFMLPLTLWIAIANPVADCGCFGDALIISNTATFWKNVLLALCAVRLVWRPRMQRWIVTPALQWIATVSTLVFILFIELCGYYRQPLADYRPYPEGALLFATDESDAADDNTEILFRYRREGRDSIFTADNLPDEEDGWEYVERISTPKPRNHSAGLTLWNADSSEELTSDETSQSGRALYVLIPAPKGIEASSSWKINTIHTHATAAGIRMAAIAAADSAEIAEWRDLAMADYPIYRAEDTSIKEVARGNPALVYTRDGRIIWKSTLASVNADSLFTPAPGRAIHPAGYRGRPDQRDSLLASWGLYIATTSVLVIISLAKYIRGAFAPLRRRRISGDDKAPHAE